MKLPKKVKILGYEFRVLITDDPELLPPGEAGMADVHAGVIAVRKTATEQDRTSTFLHEVDEVVLTMLARDYDHSEFELFCSARFAVYRDNGLCFNLKCCCGVGKDPNDA